MSNLKKMDQALVQAKSVKEAMQLTFVKELVTKNYTAATARKDADNYFNNQVFSLLTVFNEKPELKDCDRFSILGAMVYMASKGYSIEDGFFDLIKYGNILKASLNYKGHREQLRSMLTIKSVNESVLVLKDEEFVWDKANNKVIKHIGGEDVEPTSIDMVRYAYVRITFKDNDYVDVVVTQAELKKAKSKSKNKGENSVWEQWPGQMCKKVAVHRAKTIYYRKPEIQVVGINLGKEYDDTEDVDFSDVTPKAETQQNEQPTPEAKPVTQADSELENFLKK